MQASTTFHVSLPNFNNMFSFSSSHLFPSWFSLPSKPPNPALSVDNSPVKTRASRAMSDPMKLDVTLSGDSPVMNGTSNVMGEHPIMEEVKELDKDELLKWIQQKRPKLLTDDDDVEKFKAAKISGNLFLDLAGDLQSFKNECHLPFGPSKELANLASEIKGEVKEGKLLSFIPYSKH
jgi:hypothetical protein